MNIHTKEGRRNLLSFFTVLILFFIFCAGGFRILQQKNTYLNPQANIRFPQLNAPSDSNPSGTVPNSGLSETLPDTSDISPDSSNGFASLETPAALPSKFSKAPAGYFDDALFIGDSRTVGLKEYGGLDGAVFFASSGLSLYDIYKQKLTVKNMGKVTLETLLAKGSWKKIYVMLGINELGGDSDSIFNKYTALLEKIKQYQPNAVIFVQANMHVTAKRSASDPIYNNTRINAFNSRIAELADNQTVFYLDVNPLFDDADGGLRADYTNDNTHVLGKYYKVWADWIAENAVIS